MQNFQHKTTKAVNHSRQSRHGKNIFGQGQSSGKGASIANGADLAQSLPQSYLHQMMAAEQFEDQYSEAMPNVFDLNNHMMYNDNHYISNDESVR